MPAILPASAPVSEAMLVPSFMADAPTTKAGPQTFTNLLGTLMEDGDGEAQPGIVASKKPPTEVDPLATQMQMTAGPMPPPQPIVVPAVLRMHFFLAATAAPKASAGESETQAEEPKPDPSVALSVTQPVLVSTIPTASASLPAIQAEQGQVKSPSPKSVTETLEPPKLAAAVASFPKSGRPPLSRREDPVEPNTPRAVPFVEALVPSPVVQQAVQLPIPPLKTAAEEQAKPTAVGPAPLPVLTSVTDVLSSATPKEHSNESATPRFAVNSEEPVALPQVQLAFTAKLTQVSPGSKPVAAPLQSIPKVSSAPIHLPDHSASPEMPKVAAPSQSQGDSQSESEQQQPTLRQIPKQKIQIDTPERAAEQVAVRVAEASSNTPFAPVTASAGPEPRDAVVKPGVSAAPTPVIDTRPDVAALPQISQTLKSEPVRDLSIRVGDIPGNQVDVKIQERGGEVHVAVLSSIPEMTADLRQQVGDLVGKLDRAGYHAETFQPSGAATASQNSQHSDSGNPGGSNAGQQQQQQEARQQFLNRQKRGNQTQWLQQMNGSAGLAAVEGIERS